MHRIMEKLFSAWNGILDVAPVVMILVAVAFFAFVAMS
jgi:hypothetical protein